MSPHNNVCILLKFLWQSVLGIVEQYDTRKPADGYNIIVHWLNHNFNSGIL